jgi:hypothetical protein
MFFVLQFELILQIGSIKCAYGGRQKNISRAPRWTGLVYTLSKTSLGMEGILYLEDATLRRNILRVQQFLQYGNLGF